MLLAQMKLLKASKESLGNYNGNAPIETLQMQPVNVQERMESAPNSLCKEQVCSPSFWVAERGLCLYCGYRK